MVKVLNDGMHLRDKRAIITFLTSKTSKGIRMPKYIWVGLSDNDIEFAQHTKKDLIIAIERDNRLFPKSLQKKGSVGL